jgi:hypothetical protein
VTVHGVPETLVVTKVVTSAPAKARTLPGAMSKSDVTHGDGAVDGGTVVGVVVGGGSDVVVVVAIVVVGNVDGGTVGTVGRVVVVATVVVVVGAPGVVGGGPSPLPEGDEHPAAAARTSSPRAGAATLRAFTPTGRARAA